MVSHATARKIAIEIGNKLLPHCDRLNIAGSIRRGANEVKDIEIVCQPKRVKIGNVSLFGEDTREEVVKADFIEIVKKLGKAVKGKPDGRYMQIEIDNPDSAKKINLDLFMPQPDDYFRQFAIRTGSAMYSQKVIAEGWRKIGWVGTEDGLRLEIQCVGYKQPDGKTKWKCNVDRPEIPPIWASEQQFFEWLGVQYLPPSLRYV